MSSLLPSIAFWEFRRWFRWKSTLITLGLGLVSSLLFVGVRALLDKEESALLPDAPSWAVVVTGAHHLDLESEDDGLVYLMPDPLNNTQSHLDKLSRGELSAVLVVNGPHDAVLYDNPLLGPFPYKAELHVRLERAFRAKLVRELGAFDELRESDTAPVNLRIETTEIDAGIAAEREHAKSSGTGNAAAAFIVNLLLLLGVYVGLAVQFYAITAEKQLRVTEQILACISPQTWIDGKILGLSLLSLITTFTYAVAMLLFVWTANPFADFIQLPTFALDPVKSGVMIAAAIGGFLLWVTFFAALAATVNDPNTSSRGGFMVLPMLPFGLAIVAFNHPDSLWPKVLSWFPPTASPLLATRLILGDVAWWEILGSLTVLAFGVLFLRRLAGRIFGLAVLMHGNEPSWQEIARWIRKT